MNLTEIFKGKGAGTGIAPHEATHLLAEDHQRVQALFKEFRGLGEDDRQEKSRVFGEIRRELTLHAKVEEEIFYPAVKKLAEDLATDLVLEAAEEHAIVKTLLEQLEGLDSGDGVFDAKMKVMMEAVEHHADEEEGDMFPEARKGLDEQALLALGARIEARKSELLAGAEGAGRKSARSAALAPKQRKPARSAVKAGSAGKSSGSGARRRAR